MKNDCILYHSPSKQCSSFVKKVICPWRYESVDNGLEYHEKSDEKTKEKWVQVGLYAAVSAQSDRVSPYGSFKAIGPNRNDIAVIEDEMHCVWLCSLKNKMEMMTDNKNRIGCSMPKRQLEVDGAISCIHPVKSYFTTINSKDGSISVYDWSSVPEKLCQYRVYLPKVDKCTTSSKLYAYDIEFGADDTILVLQKMQPNIMPEDHIGLLASNVAEHTGKLHIVDWRAGRSHQLIDINSLLSADEYSDKNKEDHNDEDYAETCGYEIVHFDYNYIKPNYLLLAYQNKVTKDLNHCVGIYNIKTEKFFKIPITYSCSALVYSQPEHIVWANKKHNYRAQEISKYVLIERQAGNITHMVDEIDKKIGEYKRRLDQRNELLFKKSPALTLINKILLSTGYKMFKQEPLQDIDASMLNLRSLISKNTCI
jgi:hypothetical protein